MTDDAPASPAPATPTTAERCNTLRTRAADDADAIVLALKALGPLDDATRGLALVERELANTGELLQLARQRLEALT